MADRAAAAQTSAAAVWQSAPGDGAADAATLPVERPIARLTDAGRGVDLYILPDADWDSLLDGPGLFAGVAPGLPGISVIAGHRETHFAFLRDLRVGETLSVTDSDGRVTTYRVTDARVVDGRTTRVGGPTPADAPATLLLVTCYPFDSEEIGPERYVVTAVAS
ncbi:MAG: class D sortase [Alphaproteobacteria bacterium]